MKKFEIGPEVTVLGMTIKREGRYELSKIVGQDNLSRHKSEMDFKRDSLGASNIAENTLDIEVMVDTKPVPELEGIELPKSSLMPFLSYF